MKLKLLSLQERLYVINMVDSSLIFLAKEMLRTLAFLSQL
jgi:hypothetical protein